HPFNVTVQITEEVWDECILNDERAPFERLEPEEGSRLRCLLSKPQRLLGSLMARKSVRFVTLNRFEKPVTLSLANETKDPRFPVLTISLPPKRTTTKKKR